MSSTPEPFHIALIGNPNCGKTTIFNNLTSTYQKVGNWPGVTVEKKSGEFTHNNKKIIVTDLPGIYSISPAPQNNSIDQQITNNFVKNAQTDLYINILDATNLKRNLYLTLQLISLGLPCIVVINMLDKTKLQKINIAGNELSKILNRPVLAISSTQNSKASTQQLKDLIIKEMTIKSSYNQNIKYTNNIVTNLGLNISHDIDVTSLNKINQIVLNLIQNDSTYESYGQALQLLELELEDNTKTNESSLHKAKQEIFNYYQEDADIVIADLRYQLINSIYSQTVTKTEKIDKHAGYSLKLDDVVLNKYLGIPIFLFILYSIFEISISFGEVLKPFFELTSGFLAEDITTKIFSLLGFNNQFTTTISQGLASGLTTVAGFIPQITLMFILLTFLEDSGYMARAAFVMDRLMQAAGLPGKSFVPLIISFGCNVPAILSTRTLDNTRDRILTCLMSPFMSCSARLAIFIVFASAFFPDHQGLMVFLLYLTGIIVAILTGLILKSTILASKPSPFILELPSYNIPTINNIFIATWQRCKGFVIRAGKLIVPICIGLQLLNSIQPNGQWVNNGIDHEQNLSSSVLAQTGKLITPVLNPIGVSNDNWPATVGLITGSLAKEVVIGTLNTLYTDYNYKLSETSTNYNSNINNNFITRLTDTIKDARDQSSERLDNLLSYNHYNIYNKEIDDAEFSGQAFNKLSSAFPSIWAAFAYCLFVLLYMPCLSTFSILMKEIGKNWAIASLIWSLDIAYTTATIVYQVSNLANTPYKSISIILLLIIFHVFIYKFLKSGKLNNLFKDNNMNFNNQNHGHSTAT